MCVVHIKKLICWSNNTYDWQDTVIFPYLMCLYCEVITKIDEHFHKLIQAEHHRYIGIDTWYHACKKQWMTKNIEAESCFILLDEAWPFHSTSFICGHFELNSWERAFVLSGVAANNIFNNFLYIFIFLLLGCVIVYCYFLIRTFKINVLWTLLIKCLILPNFFIFRLNIFFFLHKTKVFYYFIFKLYKHVHT